MFGFKPWTLKTEYDLRSFVEVFVEETLEVASSLDIGASGAGMVADADIDSVGIGSVGIDCVEMIVVEQLDDIEEVEIMLLQSLFLSPPPFPP